jgi:hypothetical protein
MVLKLYIMAAEIWLTSYLGWVPYVMGLLALVALLRETGVSKLSQSYQVGGSTQIGGAVIHVDGSNNSTGSSAYVVIGRNLSSNFSTHSGNADGIIFDNDNVDKNGFFKGSWG